MRETLLTYYKESQLLKSVTYLSDHSHSEAYLEPSQVSKMELSVKIVNGFQQFSQKSLS